MENYVLEPRADVLIESMRNIGYTFESALADIIDNSISAKATKIDILFDANKICLGILDNGNGMDFDELKEAMRFGSKDPLSIRAIDDLGRFGLGLKSASLSQCRKFTVVSKKNGEYNSLCWDLDYVKQTNDWTVLPVKNLVSIPFIDELYCLEHGTIVLWENFDKVSDTTSNLLHVLEEKLASTSDYIALVFHMFINEGLIISFNNNPLPKIDPFLQKNTYTQILKTENLGINDQNGVMRTVSIQPFVLPHFNHLKQSERQMLEKNNDYNKQGFYVYRNKRLIIWGTWFRMVGSKELSKNARVKVDIPNTLDFLWSIDIKKSSASLPASFKSKLMYAVKDSISKSKRIYKFKGRKVNNDGDYETIWDSFKLEDGIKFSVNRDLPIIKKLTASLNDNQITMLEILLSDIENNLPTYNIYNNIADDNDNFLTDDELTIKNKVEMLVKSLNITSKEEFINIIGDIFKSEPYCNFVKVYNTMLKEYM